MAFLYNNNENVHDNNMVGILKVIDDNGHFTAQLYKDTEPYEVWVYFMFNGCITKEPILLGDKDLDNLNITLTDNITTDFTTLY